MMRGWIEVDGRVVSGDAACMLSADELTTAGGEFALSTRDISARDCFGIMPAEIPAGKVVCGGVSRPVIPHVPTLPLDAAVVESVRLRCAPNAVVTLSGGVDSALVAAISGLPAIAVGAEDSHDMRAAEYAADILGLSLTIQQISMDDILAALPRVCALLPGATPMDIELALSGWFICSLASRQGAERVLTGQAADELFAGYARYGRSANLRRDLSADFAGLDAQRARDLAVASQFGVWYSMPYMDMRVVRAARILTPDELVCGEQRKIALRRVAERFLPPEIAWKPKKAMQYGTGVTKLLARAAKEAGCSTTHAFIEKIRSGSDE